MFSYPESLIFFEICCHIGYDNFLYYLFTLYFLARTQINFAFGLTSPAFLFLFSFYLYFQKAFCACFLFLSQCLNELVLQLAHHVFASCKDIAFLVQFFFFPLTLNTFFNMDSLNSFEFVLFFLIFFFFTFVSFIFLIYNYTLGKRNVKFTPCSVHWGLQSQWLP